MPRYDNECEPCGIVFETIQSFRDPQPTCRVCGGRTQRVITSAPNFRLLGVGWAADNYAVTDMGGRMESEQADRQSTGKSGIVSFPGQKNKGRA